jgi:hypothetical protein
MRNRLTKSSLNLVLIAGVVLLVTGFAQAVTIPWANATGSNAAFGWSGGENNTGRFGNPTVSTAGFVFDQMDNFIAQGGGGNSASTSDFARVTVDVANSTPPGAPPIHTIIVSEWGTWSVDAGSVPTDFSIQADFSVFRFLPAPPGTSGSLTLPVVFNADGTWTATRTLTANAGLDWQRFQITVTNTIQVNGTAPMGSFVEKDGMTIYVPEPASVLLVLAGFLPFARRRRCR